MADQEKEREITADQTAELKAFLRSKFGKIEARRYERYIPNLISGGYTDADSLKSAAVEDLMPLGLPDFLAERLAAGPKRDGPTLLVKFMLLPLVSGFVIIALCLYFLKNYVPGSGATLFLRAPTLKDLPEFDAEYQNSMLWGTYRPGYYFGLRTRQPRPMSVGFMWYDPDNPADMQNGKIRHEARQDDGLSTYGWMQHDGHSFGEQVLVDGGYNITLHWVKTVSPSSGPGGDWAVRVKVTQAKDKVQPKRISLVFYFVDEDFPHDDWILFPEGSKKVEDLRDGAWVVAGSSHSLGHWAVHMETSVTAPANYAVMQLPGDFPPHRIKELVMHQIAENARTKESLEDLHMMDAWGAGANCSIFQLTMRVGGTAEVVFVTNLEDGGDDRLIDLKGSKLTEQIKRRKKKFTTTLEDQFLGEAGKKLGHLTKKVVSAALSNLMGSMGYFYGESLVELPGRMKTVKPYGPAALYTCTPSRSFFPRGFLWDEGFHQLLLQRLDPKLSRDVLAHWLDVMNSQGWIAREQILGEEARSRVPDEYIVQNPSHANPPSLFLPLARMAETLENPYLVSLEEVEANRKFLQTAWPRLEAWFQWYNRTQQGPLDYTFRWHGRNRTTNLEMNPKTLMSGLDDYPRASHPSDYEMHLDLRCWVTLAARTMTVIGTALDLPKSAVEPYRHLTGILADMKTLNRLHKDTRTGMYFDWGNHTEDIHMENITAFNPDGSAKQVLIRMVDKAPDLQLVPNFGYNSLFPLLMQLFPADSKDLAVQLKLLSDPGLLYSPYGLRSLSQTSKQYRKHNTATDPPYWRGAVWININYLALRSLHHYCHLEGPSQVRACELHKELRELVLGNVAMQYEKSGYLWEQYDDLTGQGKGTTPFTGWTALVALIAAEAY